MTVAKFDFPIPLSRVEKFIIGTRKIRTVEWKDVVLPTNTDHPLYQRRQGAKGTAPSDAAQPGVVDGAESSSARGKDSNKSPTLSYQVFLNPKVEIEKVVANNVAHAIAKEALVLASGNGGLEFHYRNADTNAAAPPLEFRYKIDGIDPTWIEAGKRKVVYYNNLPPGKYRFSIIARYPPGEWNNSPTTLDFEIK
jgi:hypothetical protein